MRRILVIRLGAFGDFVQSFSPFAAIRAHHAADEVTLLTTTPFAGLALQTPWFDRVIVDERPAWWDVPGLLRLARMLRRFDRVYDLQTSARSTRYFRLAGRPEWSGIAPGCTHPHTNPARDAMHTRERQREQLAMAGITAFPDPDLGWLRGEDRGVRPPYALLVPGASRPAKRWPAERYGELARRLAGPVPVILGSAADRDLAATIQAAAPDAIDLTGRTGLADIATLACGAAFAVGNDTGPMHLAAACRCRCVVLFSADSDPALTAPRGPDGAWPTVLRAPDLADLSVARVAAALT